MAKEINGGVVTDEAAAVLALMQKMGRRRSRIISEALEQHGLREFGRPLTITNVHKTNAGWFNNWSFQAFNNWFNNFKVALRANLKLPEFDRIPWFAWVGIGVVGTVYFALMLPH